jgi:hypothetical protein
MMSRNSILLIGRRFDLLTILEGYWLGACLHYRPFWVSGCGGLLWREAFWRQIVDKKVWGVGVLRGSMVLMG